MVPPTLSTVSRSVASPSVSFIRNVPSLVSFITRSWVTWYVILLHYPARGNVVQYTAIEGQGSYLTRGTGQPMKLPLAASKPLPSLSKALIGAFPTHHILRRLSQ